MSQDRVFELRTYVAHPGKLDALNARFRDHTCTLFARHGMDVIGFWTPADGPDAEHTLIYLLGFPSQAAMARAWEAFRADPEWNRVKSESERGGPLVARLESVTLRPTDYSALR